LKNKIQSIDSVLGTS